MRGRTEAEGWNQIQTRSGRSRPEPACVSSGTVGRHATADAGRSSVKRSLGRAYRLLWISNGASAVGTGMTITASARHPAIAEKPRQAKRKVRKIKRTLTCV